MTQLCERGCGLKATYYAPTPKKWFCSKPPTACPVIKEKAKKTNKENYKGPESHWNYGRKLSERTKAKIGKANSISLKGYKHSEETKRKHSKSLKEQWEDSRRNKDEQAERAKNIANIRGEDWVPWNKGKKTGQVPWNKGMRKKEPLEILDRDDLIYSDFGKYRNRVAVRTERTYQQHKDEINPNDYPRGKAGVDGAYHLDHIVSVREGFENQIPVEKVSAKENLQMLPWLENVQKYDGKR